MMKRYFFCLFVLVAIIKISNCHLSEVRGVKNCQKVTAQCTTGDLVTVTHNGTTLITPTSLPKTCIFDFPRQPGVCQLRLDFPKFNLNNPERNGNCINDSMSITGSVTVNELDICGTGASSANHMYLDYGSSQNSIKIRIKTSGNMDIMTYGYEIFVTQIMCDSAKRVPQDCLQYYKGPSGIVSSFNYAQQQLNSENYKVCVEKRFPGDRIRWSLCNHTDPTQPPLSSDDMCLQGESCFFSPNANRICDTDYIEIPGSELFRYCDISQFWRSSTITTENFWVRVKMDDRELQTLPPHLPNSPQSCSTIDASDFPNYILVDSPDGSCSFWPRAVDSMNKGFCLAYEVV